MLPSERTRRLEEFAATFGPLPGEPEPLTEAPAGLGELQMEDGPAFERPLTSPEPRPATPAPRRTIEITGHPSPGRARARRRGPRPARNGPDRLALWAVVMGILLALVAATAARGDEPPAAQAPPTAEAVR